jgi:ATP-dependent DNA helicase RecG
VTSATSTAPARRGIAPDTPIQFLKGVGQGRAALFTAAGYETAGDLLFNFPFRYEDRRHPLPIAQLGRYVDGHVLLRGRVLSASSRLTPRKRLDIFEIVLQDSSGAVKVVWFNQKYLKDQLKRGDQLSVYGVPRTTDFGHLQIESPEWEKFEGEEDDDGEIVPIYSRIGNVPPKTMRRIMATALDALPALEEPLDPTLRERLAVIPLADALDHIHRPKELDDAFLAQRAPAHLRVILQEFFTFQLALRVRRAREEVKRKDRTIEIDDALRAEVLRVLPFKLTGAQKRVLREIADDLQGSKPMYRLLQGDVGSGKTIVALIAAMIAIHNGHQVALLAPTEILAEQHYQRLVQLLGTWTTVARSTGSMGAAERRAVLAGLKDGSIRLVVGTHALLEKKVVFKSLGLAIVDEQHRFGVEQRQRLFAKAESPDILVMTATPIPRSLALAMYGDLELSVIDELPPGRQQIKTAVRDSSEIARAYSFMDDEIERGAQAYIVYPIIEESEKLDLQPLTEGFEALRKRFPLRRLAMLHGRMSADEKEATMQRFKRGDIDILVATTVIEVGIDVPNASMMMIMSAERFGLSQLHQLRGRVGRGERKSYCVLVHEPRVSMESRDRLKIFEQTKNGFDVAEKDLEIRGPGEFLGTRQSGVARFRFGNILRDHDLMEKARDTAIAYIETEGLDAAETLAKRLLGVAGRAVARD